ncbi:MAG: glycosyltransferase family 2 protein [Magnetococcales bacterium]|nr:glycosyltransferase family 2 protein [Magnetococcales bacterium]
MTSLYEAFGVGVDPGRVAPGVDGAEDGPLVSVIMPMFNAATFVEASIRSIQAQGYRHWELLVVDNASTDESPARVVQMAEADGRIQLIRRQVNSGGPAAPRNDGIRGARGRYITFLDADDLWHPDKLQKQVAHMELHSATFMCFGKMVVDSEGVLYAHGRQSELGELVTEGADLFDNLLRYNNFIPLHTVMLRRGESVEGLLFDEDPRLNAVEDFDLWLQIAKRGEKIDFLNEFFSIYRLHAGNLSHGMLKGVRIQLRLAHKWRSELTAGSRLRLMRATIARRIILPLLRRLFSRFLLVVR